MQECLVFGDFWRFVGEKKIEVKSKIKIFEKVSEKVLTKSETLC